MEPSQDTAINCLIGETTATLTRTLDKGVDPTIGLLRGHATTPRSMKAGSRDAAEDQHFPRIDQAATKWQTLTGPQKQTLYEAMRKMGMDPEALADELQMSLPL